MAWENAYINNFNSGTLINPADGGHSAGWENMVAHSTKFSVLGDDFTYGVGIDSDVLIWQNGIYSMRLFTGHLNQTPVINSIKVYKNNEFYFDLFSNPNLKGPAYIAFAVDHENQLGGCVVGALQYSRGTEAIGYSGATQLAYEFITGNPVINFQWSSVPAISGKNGILLPMSTLNDINDGNEVTTSDTSKFNPNDSSNIKNLVDAVVNDF